MNDNNKKDLRSSFPPNLQFFSTMEVAIIMGASRKTVISWINEGRLPAFRMGPNNRLIRVRRQDLEAFIEKYTPEAELVPPERISSPSTTPEA